MPFVKVKRKGRTLYRGPSGRTFNRNQVRRYYARGQSFDTICNCGQTHTAEFFCDVKSTTNNDPTGTLSIRKSLARELEKRWRQLKLAVNKVIRDDDSFALSSSSIMAAQVISTEGGRLKAFQTWLDNSLSVLILGHDNGAWLASPISRGYNLGAQRANRLLGTKDAGFKSSQPRNEQGEWTEGSGSARRSKGEWTTKKSFDEDEYDAIGYYLGSGPEINDHLRGHGNDLDREALRAIASIDEMMENSSIDKNSVVWRGTRIPSKDFSSKIGKLMTLNGYTSTSKNKDVAEQFAKRGKGALMEIFLPKGTPALDLSKAADHFDSSIDDEQEVVLKHQAKFRIESVSGNLVRLRVIP